MPLQPITPAGFYYMSVCCYGLHAGGVSRPTAVPLFHVGCVSCFVPVPACLLSVASLCANKSSIVCHLFCLLCVGCSVLLRVYNTRLLNLYLAPIVPWSSTKGTGTVQRCEGCNIMRSYYSENMVTQYFSCKASNSARTSVLHSYSHKYIHIHLSLKHTQYSYADD